MKHKTVIEISLLIAIASAIVLILAPAVARIRRTPDEASCQSNMRCIARAIDLYLSDNHNSYPTNRRLMSGGLSTPVPRVDLSPIDSNIGPYEIPTAHYVNGPNWVEAIYPYIINAAQKAGRGWQGVFACPNAANVYPLGATTTLASYAFNFSLAEQPRISAKNPSNLMLLREMDTRSFCAMMRPTINCTDDSGHKPTGTFLASYRDPFYSWTPNPNLHAQGSYITFADGHVKWFSTAYYPTDAQITAAMSWDSETHQWYNYGSGARGTVPDEMIKSIAVTP